MPRRFGLHALRLACVATAALAAAQADTTDLHAHWENHCAECHGHAGPFARERLRVEDGRLVSTHWGGRLETFLASHHAAGPVLPELVATLAAQAETDPRYAARCAGCHGPAADLVLVAMVRDGAGLALRDGTPLEVFLERHAGLEAGRVRRQAEPRPPGRRHCCGRGVSAVLAGRIG